ncbi:MAG: GTPase Era [Deltaproteobacteria bacterium HGW-Deltaproteobacteria-22]|jgi:GTP-binding protein Era|nr:MAG: GTPase Era [Deltaproteobacteria bacterium HGW-Deltaproteobacteria-22]
MPTTPIFRCGTIAILGRPNVGKSTLLNTILTEKVSIVTPKPQTTRQRILGIVPGPGYQAIFIDTPGYHQFKKKLNQAMVEAALSAIGDADLVLVLVDASDTTDEFSDPHGAGVLVRRCEEIGRPVFVMLNKIDRVRDKKALLPIIERWAAFSPAVKNVIPLSAAKGSGISELLVEIYGYLPEGPALYPEDDLTDQTEREITAEIVRETCILCLREELPYATAVTIERFSETAARRSISGIIWVERDSQKAIVIGKRGSMIRHIGQTAREQLIARFGVETQLFLEVKVHPGWTDDPASLRELGYKP